MRRNFVPQTVRHRGPDSFFGLGTDLHLPVEVAKLSLQETEFFLLTKYRPVKFLDQIFHQAESDFEFGHTVAHDIGFR